MSFKTNRISSGFERLVAALVGRLLGVPIAVASSGFQHGADAGPAGQQGRRFRLECKNYSEKTSLNERELREEIAQAVARDEALEAWILITTRTVSEQIRHSLDESGDQHGVPVLAIDWMEYEVGPLAALCASAPNLVETIFSSAAGRAARDLKFKSDDAIRRLKRNLESWCLGFESLRQKSHERLDKIWNNPRESRCRIRTERSGRNQKREGQAQECTRRAGPLVAWTRQGRRTSGRRGARRCRQDLGDAKLACRNQKGATRNTYYSVIGSGRQSGRIRYGFKPFPGRASIYIDRRQKP